MTENIQEIHLVVRENQREAQKKARQNIMRAAITGKSMDMADVAMARGLVLRERENSIFSDAWVPLAVLFLIIGLVAGRQPTMLALGLVLLLIVGISTTWKNLSLWGVTYSRRFNRTRVFPGEPIELTITVGNDKKILLVMRRWLPCADWPIDCGWSGRSKRAAASFCGQKIFLATSNGSARWKQNCWPKSSRWTKHTSVVRRRPKGWPRCRT